MICRSGSPKRARARAHLVAAERIVLDAGSAPVRKYCRTRLNVLPKLIKFEIS
jgi:hypothetical protein